jgi:hypothetical protein
MSHDCITAKHPSFFDGTPQFDVTELTTVGNSSLISCPAREDFDPSSKMSIVGRSMWRL